LRFPADHAAHPDTHVEWWYVTGWLHLASAGAIPPPGSRRPDFGFQITFFRSRTDVAQASASRFAARQLVFAHFALTDLSPTAGSAGKSTRGILLHDQRAAREGFGLAQAPSPADATQVARLRDWSLSRLPAVAPDPTRLKIAARSEHFALSLELQGTQPVMLQGDSGPFCE